MSFGMSSFINLTNLAFSETRNLPNLLAEKRKEIRIVTLSTMPNNHFCSTYILAYHHLKHQHSPKACGKKNFDQSEAREPPTSGHRSVMEGPTMVLIVSIGLLYTYT